MLFSRDFVGLDIDAKYIKVAHLRIRQQRFKVETLIKKQNPIKKTITENLKDMEIEILVNTLIQLKENLQCNNVIAGISNECVIFRLIQLPALKRWELKKVLYWECQNIASNFIDEMVIDYQTIGKSNVLFAITKRCISTNYVNIIKKAGFNLIALDIYPLSWQRMLRLAEQKTIIVIEIKPAGYTIAAFQDQKLIFCRYISLDLTRFFNYTGSKHDIDKFNEEDMILIKRFLTEVLNLLNIYLQNINELHNNKLLLLSESPYFLCFKNVLEKKLHIPVSTVCDLNFSFSGKEHKVLEDRRICKYFNAIGFALRGK